MVNDRRSRLWSVVVAQKVVMYAAESPVGWVGLPHLAKAAWASPVHVQRSSASAEKATVPVQKMLVTEGSYRIRRGESHRARSPV